MSTTSPSGARPDSPVAGHGGDVSIARVDDVRPKALVGVIALLLVNLTLSVAVTVAALVTHGALARYQLDHLHVADATLRRDTAAAAEHALWLRIGVNAGVSVAYAFLVRALLRGRRWAYRRVITVGALGIVALTSVVTEPYPAWMHAEQLAQAVILAALLILVTRPAVKAHFAAGLPGRDIRRFRTS